MLNTGETIVNIGFFVNYIKTRIMKNDHKDSSPVNTKGGKSSDKKNISTQEKKSQSGIKLWFFILILVVILLIIAFAAGFVSI